MTVRSSESFKDPGVGMPFISDKDLAAPSAPRQTLKPQVVVGLTDRLPQ